MKPNPPLIAYAVTIPLPRINEDVLAEVASLLDESVGENLIPTEFGSMIRMPKLRSSALEEIRESLLDELAYKRKIFASVEDHESQATVEAEMNLLAGALNGIRLLLAAAVKPNDLN